jgi:hypothetical protein
MAAIKRKATFRYLFKKFDFLPLASEFLFSLLSFIVKNMEKFQSNSDIHTVGTGYRYV